MIFDYRVKTEKGIINIEEHGNVFKGIVNNEVYVVSSDIEVVVDTLLDKGFIDDSIANNILDTYYDTIDNEFYYQMNTDLQKEMRREHQTQRNKRFLF